MQTAAGLANDEGSIAVPILCIFFDLVVLCVNILASLSLTLSSHSLRLKAQRHRTAKQMLQAGCQGFDSMKPPTATDSSVEKFLPLIIE